MYFVDQKTLHPGGIRTRGRIYKYLHNPIRITTNSNIIIGSL
jgi:hypothetical protein